MVELLRAFTQRRSVAIISSRNDAGRHLIQDHHYRDPAFLIVPVAAQHLPLFAFLSTCTSYTQADQSTKTRLRLQRHAVPETMESIIGHCSDSCHFNRQTTALRIVLFLSVLSVSFTDRALIQIHFNNRRQVNNEAATQQSFGGEWISRIHNDANLTLGQEKVIRYGLFRNRPYLDTQFEDEYLCNWNESTPSRTNFPDVPDGVFDFTVHIATNLKILFIGDSLGLQFSIWFERACGASEHTTLAEIQKVRWKGDHVSVANEIRGGGAIAFWRMIGVWIRKVQGQLGPNRGKSQRR